jgi:hypothetical protein
MRPQVTQQHMPVVKTIKARIATSSNLIVPFTPRGRQLTGSDYTRGFARIDGKTVTGWLYDGTYEKIFYPEGIHRNFIYQLAADNIRAVRAARKQQEAA